MKHSMVAKELIENVPNGTELHCPVCGKKLGILSGSGVQLYLLTDIFEDCYDKPPHGCLDGAN